MDRLIVLVEGPTEEVFVEEVLRRHLKAKGFRDVSPRLMGDARQRSKRGGVKSWESVRKEILRHLKQDQGLLLTTMVDYYGLPQTGSKAWPGRQQAGQVAFAQKTGSVEAALYSDIQARLGDRGRPERFIPFVMMHEFEALAFSDCRSFCRGIGREDLSVRLQEIRDQFASPEHINDSPETAPSKRIMKLIPEYDKPLLGNLGVLAIGLPALMDQCPHFRDWLHRLEQGLSL